METNSKNLSGRLKVFWRWLNEGRQQSVQNVEQKLKQTRQECGKASVEEELQTGNQNNGYCSQLAETKKRDFKKFFIRKN